MLDFRFQDADLDDQRLIVSADLATLGAAEDFYHVVGLADVDSAVTGTASLYVNGFLVAGPHHEHWDDQRLGRRRSGRTR